MASKAQSVKKPEEQVTGSIPNPKEEFDQTFELMSKMSTPERLSFMVQRRRLWWTALSAIIGFIFALISVYANLDKVTAFINSILSFFISNASAQEATVAISDVSFKSNVVGGMIMLLFLLFVWALLTLSFSKKARALVVAEEAIKTLLGFFIGTITGIAGV